MESINGVADHDIAFFIFFIIVYESSKNEPGSKNMRNIFFDVVAFFVVQQLGS